ncbi:MAG: 3-methyladenine DNA glycosylase AlkC [Crocinitomix sp.]|jgi:3-methyladenine DNA glycosylase AlkC
MAEPLKNMYNTAFVENLANALLSADLKFKQPQFIKAVLNANWPELELKARTIHISEQMQAFLPYNYTAQIDVLKKVAPQFNGFTATIFPTFVELFGLNEVKTSLVALEEFTQHSTSEFAIRPFLAADPSLISVMYKWSKSDNFHVRRLATEGCRPLLPWAMKLHNYVADPSPILPILETLKNDPEDYVYRSVANSLNDISKHHPDLVLECCAKWMNESDTTRWVAKHALRTLLKKGNQRAMQLFGFGSIQSISTNNFSLLDNQIEIGNASELQIAVTNAGSQAKFRLEYAVGYLKKNGSHNEKVFQLRETTIKKGESLTFSKKVDFKDLSTRKHYVGDHYIDLKINGIPVERITFELT